MDGRLLPLRVPEPPCSKLVLLSRPRLFLHSWGSEYYIQEAGYIVSFSKVDWELG